MAYRVSNEQLEELLEFLAEHPTLAKGVGLGARSKENIEKKWNDLAIKLNAYGSGSSKTGERWKKVIQPEHPVEPGNGVVSELIIPDNSEFPVPGASTQTQVDESHHTEVETPKSQPARKRPRLRRNSTTTERLQTRVNPEWVMELERSRVQAENKMADAVLMIAEATNKIAKASLINAETSRKQIEMLNLVAAAVQNLTSVLAARDSCK